MAQARYCFNQVSLGVPHVVAPTYNGCCRVFQYSESAQNACGDAQFPVLMAPDFQATSKLGKVGNTG